MTATQTTALRVLPDTTPELVSVYGAAKAANAVLRGRGVNTKDLPPQQFYNYTTARIRAGSRPAMTTVQLADGSYRITREGLDEWLIRYMERKGHRVEIAPRDEQEAFDRAEAL